MRNFNIYFFYEMSHYLHALALVTKQTQNNPRSLDTVFFIYNLSLLQSIVVTVQRQ